MSRTGPPLGTVLPAVVAGLALTWSWRRVRATRAAAEAYREQGRLEERGQVGRDVHDTVAQGLAAITMLARAAELALERDGDAGTARERLGAIYDVAVLSLGQSQDLTHGAAYSELGADGLEPAVRTLFALTRRTLEAGAELLADSPQQWSRCGDRRLPELSLSTTGTPRRLPLPVESAVLRMIQEATSNAIRHSGASEVTIRLHFGADRIRAAVTDDGCGLAPAGGGQGVGLGLAGLARRISRLGGRLLVDSPAGAGTTIAVEFRYRRPAHGPADGRRPGAAPGHRDRPAPRSGLRPRR
ncbi:sensor histidine kinase [Kitasatospora sp. NPDC057223]|uniref:sensor histidine kinase n=1 Tax=Kitasatospora sp. NPDC057223 TaxID=3346055 RepID=UPI0036445550